MDRQQFLLGLGAAALVPAALTRPARAAEGRPLEWVVGYPAGGGSDVIARVVAEQLAKELNRPVLVNNKAGAATNIAADYVAKSRDIGHIVFTADFATLAANPWLYAKLPYDAQKDFAPLGMLGRIPMLLVVGSQVPARSYAEFTAWAQAQKDPIPFATPGAGSPHHLAGELFRASTGLNLMPVHYRGGAPAVQDIAGGSVPMMLLDTATAYPHLQGGRLRALGSATARRTASLPDLPTLREQGLADFEAYAWQGVVAPAATPAEVQAQLSRALQAALASTPVKARAQVLGIELMPGTPADMTRFTTAERARWGQVIAKAGIKVE